MIFLLDIGNSRIKWAQLRGTVLEFGESLVNTGLADDTVFEEWRSLEQPLRVVGSCVAENAVATAVVHWIRQAWGIETQWLGVSRQQGGVVNGYDDPGQLGIDRWMAVVAARQLTSRAAIVIDCGTAINIEALSSKGHYMGGAIMPGMTMSLSSLGGKTAKIGDIRLGNALAFGTSTAESVSIGVLQSTLAGIEAICDRFQRRLGTDVEYFITGGDARWIKDYLNIPVRYEKALVLRGVAAVCMEFEEISG